ncbi:hypothetical protein [Hungatella hathewayi]|mgnify:CR=1 FL=1|uniref:hypothetical protein n=1 Tax=Hungatella hathewayi TaxID=154046 RepID=UPI0006C555EE|nr:hypothetical protein [Hungatella hathewayi]CUP47599.1 Uncharacterised protein [Hungatella hathewayi]
MHKRRTLGGLPEVRIALECIVTGREDETLYMPVVCVRRRRKSKRKAERTGRVYGFLRVTLSVLMSTAVYTFLAPLAYLERGYVAYGGECIVAIMAGIAVFELLKGVIRR